MHLPWKHTVRTGIDLGSRWIKAVELDEVGGVSRRARVPRGGLALDEQEIARLCEVLRRQGFALRSASLLASHGAVRRQVIRLPDKADRARDDAIVRSAFLEEDAGTQVGSCAWWPLPKGPRNADGREALAYAADEGQTRAWLSGFEAQGVIVRGIDTHTSALTRGVSHDDCVIADLGWSRLGVTLCVGGLPVYERSDAAAGLAELVRAESERTGRTAAQVEAMIRDEQSSCELLTLPGAAAWANVVGESLKATTDYAVRRYGLASPPSVVLTGGGATQRVASKLQGHLGSACEIGDAGVDSDQFAAMTTARRWAA